MHDVPGVDSQVLPSSLLLGQPESDEHFMCPECSSLTLSIVL